MFEVIVAVGATGHEYLKARNDREQPNNLLRLPECLLRSLSMHHSFSAQSDKIIFALQFLVHGALDLKEPDISGAIPASD